MKLFTKQFLFFFLLGVTILSMYASDRLVWEINNTTQLCGIVGDCILSLWFIANRWPTYKRNILRSPLSDEMEAVHVFIKKKKKEVKSDKQEILTFWFT